MEGTINRIKFDKKTRECRVEISLVHKKSNTCCIIEAKIKDYEEDKDNDILNLEEIHLVLNEMKY
jgi:hypothetical protein